MSPVRDIEDFDFRFETHELKPDETEMGRGRFDGPHRAPDERVYGLTYIYFIQAEHGGPIKIGQSTDPIQRLNQLQTSSPYHLQLTRVVSGHPQMEFRLHALFKDHRLNGEWFEPVPALAEMADAIPGDGPEAVENKKVSWRTLEGEIRDTGKVKSVGSSRKPKSPKNPLPLGYTRPKPDTILNRWDERRAKRTDDQDRQIKDAA